MRFRFDVRRHMPNGAIGAAMKNERSQKAPEDGLGNPLTVSHNLQNNSPLDKGRKNGGLIMMGGINPWTAMWSQPRATIRSIIQINPKYGVFTLASLYALQNFLYFSNYWSLGLSVPFYAIIMAGLILCPILGLVWLYLGGWFLRVTGKWLHGEASPLHLRTALAWSKIPTSLNLAMWVILLLVQSDSVFIQDAGGPSTLFINFIALTLSIWSFVLLVQSIREVQGFSILRSILNIFLAWILFSLLSFFLFSILRLFYIKFIY